MAIEVVYQSTNDSKTGYHQRRQPGSNSVNSKSNRSLQDQLLTFVFISYVKQEKMDLLISYIVPEMIADLFTKPIPRGQFEKLRDLLGMEEFVN